MWTQRERKIHTKKRSEKWIKKKKMHADFPRAGRKFLPHYSLLHGVLAVGCGYKIICLKRKFEEKNQSNEEYYNIMWQ